MKNIMDLHTHTLASGHAYNTIIEMAREASLKGLKMLGITEHAPALPETCGLYYFSNLRIIERELFDIELFFGVELNIMDTEGKIDMPEEILKEMDITVASLHKPCIPCGSSKENTRAVIKSLENKYIDMIGHPDDDNYPLNYDELVRAAKENNKLLEVNNSSLNSGNFRPGARENYIEMLKYCEKYGAKVIINSDAHIHTRVGGYEKALEVINEVKFPHELVLNDKPEEIKKFIKKYRMN